MQEVQKILEGYHAILEIPVQWGDMDIAAHVNSVQYAKYFESARVNYYRMITGESDFSSKAPVVSNITMNYKIPVSFPDTVYVGTKVVEIGESSIMMECAITTKMIPAITTTASLRMVYFDLVKKSKAPLSQAFVNKVKEIEKL